jgi:hypothetical protein
MDSATASAWPLILIELVLVMGGVLAFGLWQIRSTRRDRERMLAERAARAAQTPQTPQGATAGPDTPPALTEGAGPEEHAAPPRPDGQG